MPERAPAKNQSAGLLLVRNAGGDIEILLGHPGGPFLEQQGFRRVDNTERAVAPGESPLAAARREFAEETGHHPNGKLVSLGNAKQPGGKVVHIWAVQEDWDAGRLRSNTFEMEWPPKSGRWQTFPELDRASWFRVPEARQKILKGQAVFIDRLLEVSERHQASAPRIADIA